MTRKTMDLPAAQGVDPDQSWLLRWYLDGNFVSELTRRLYRWLWRHHLWPIIQRWRVERTLRRWHDTLDITPIANHYWLWGGALLGMIREGRLLSHDLVDIDFAYRREERAAFQATIPHLIAAGFQPHYYWRNNEGVITEYTFYKNQIRFDFFEFQPQGKLFNYWLYETTHCIEALCQIPQHGLQPVQFWRRQWLIPDQPEATLRAIYGDWRTPNPQYNWFNDEKSIVARYPWQGSKQVDSTAIQI